MPIPHGNPVEREPHFSDDFVGLTDLITARNYVPINDGTRLGIPLSGEKPDYHKQLPVFFRDPNVMPIETVSALDEGRLKDALNVDTSSIEVYGGEEPKRFLKMRRFILGRTVNLADAARDSLQNDVLTSWHVADVVARGESIAADSVVTKFADKVADFNDAVGRTDLAGQKQTPTVNPAPGSNRDRQQLKPSEGKQIKRAKKLIEKRAKWLTKEQEYEHLTESNSTPLGLNTAAHTANRAVMKTRARGAGTNRSILKEEFIKTAKADVTKYKKAAKKAAKKRAKLQAVESAIARS